MFDSLNLFSAFLLACAPAVAFNPNSAKSCSPVCHPTITYERHFCDRHNPVMKTPILEQTFTFDYLVCFRGKWGEFRRIDALTRTLRAALIKGQTIHFLHDDGVLLTLESDFMGHGKPWGSPLSGTSEIKLLELLKQIHSGKSVPGASLLHREASSAQHLCTVMETALSKCDAAWVLSERGEQLLCCGEPSSEVLGVRRVLVGLGGVRDMTKEESDALEAACKTQSLPFSKKSLGRTSELTSKCVKFLEVARQGWLPSSYRQIATIGAAEIRWKNISPLHVIVYSNEDLCDFLNLPIVDALWRDVFLGSYIEYKQASLSLIGKDGMVLTAHKPIDRYRYIDIVDRMQEYAGLDKLLLREQLKLGNDNLSKLHLLYADESSPSLAKSIEMNALVGTSGPVAVIFAPSSLYPEVKAISGTVASCARASIGHWSLASGFVRVMHNQNFMASAIQFASKCDVTDPVSVHDGGDEAIFPPDSDEFLSDASHAFTVKTPSVQRNLEVLPTPCGDAKRFQPILSCAAPHVLLLVTQGMQDVAVEYLVDRCSILGSAITVLPSVSISEGDAAVGLLVVTLHSREDLGAQIEQLQQAAVVHAVLAFVAAATGMATVGGHVWVKGSSDASYAEQMPAGVLADIADLISSSLHWPSALELLAAAGLPHVRSFRASALSNLAHSGPNQTFFVSHDVVRAMGAGVLRASELGAHGKDEPWTVNLNGFDMELFGMLGDGHFACGILLKRDWRVKLDEVQKNYKVLPFCEHFGRVYWERSLSPMYMQRLRPSTAMLLLLLSRVQPGDTVLDPFGGIGTIAIEAATHFEQVTCITSDMHHPTSDAAIQNAMQAQPHLARGSSLTAQCWDARNLSSIADASVDRYIAEICFNNVVDAATKQSLPPELRKFKKQWPDVLAEVRRVLRPKTGRCVLLVNGYTRLEKVITDLNANALNGVIGKPSSEANVEDTKDAATDLPVDSVELLAAASEGIQGTPVAQVGTQMPSKQRLLVIEERRAVAIGGKLVYAISLRAE